jgi:hypothetical protein
MLTTMHGELPLIANKPKYTGSEGCCYGLRVIALRRRLATFEA